MSSNKIGELIRTLRTERGWTQGDLAKLMSTNQASISKRESGKVQSFSRNDRREFAKAFGISVDDFDDMWRSAGAAAVTQGDIPVINRAPAGEIVDYEEHGVDSSQGFEYIDRGDLDKSSSLFAVIVAGESMQPTLSDGDYVVFKPMDRYRAGEAMADGSVCFARLDSQHENGCMIARARFLSDQRIMFVKDNPDYRSIIVDREHVEQMALAVERRSKRGLTPRAQGSDALHA